MIKQLKFPFRKSSVVHNYFDATGLYCKTSRIGYESIKIKIRTNNPTNAERKTFYLQPMKEYKRSSIKNI